ncbi:unnamed protein product, partial [Prorocentrum cordatum]
RRHHVRHRSAEPDRTRHGSDVAPEAPRSRLGIAPPGLAGRARSARCGPEREEGEEEEEEEEEARARSGRLEVGIEASGIGAGRDRGTTSPARPRPPACSSWPTTETAAHVKRPGHTARQHLEQPPGQPSGYSGEHAPGTPKPSQLPGSRLPKCWGQASDEGLIDDHLPHREFVARVIWAQPTSLSHGLPSASDQGPRL